MIVPIPEDMVSGIECLDYEVPWVVPEAIYKLDDELNQEDVVLEFGSGGSTLFYAKRCKKVISVETSASWYGDVQFKLHTQGVSNVNNLYALDMTAMLRIIMHDIDLSEITVLSVDTEGNFNRSAIVNKFFENWAGTKLRMVILDNYSHEGLFPDHHDKSLMNSLDWGIFTYNHERWVGDGTRIYIKKS